MRNISRQYRVAALAVILAFGSASLVAEGIPSRNNWVRAYSLFLQFTETSVGLLVLPYPSGVESPAQRAGILAGDVIVSVNGRKVSEWDLRRIMNTNIGETVFFKVSRGGRLREIPVTPSETLVRPSVKMLLDILNGRATRVALAVVVTAVEDNCVSSPARGGGSLTLWSAAAKERIARNMKDVVQSSVGKDPNFSLVERSRIERVMNQYRLNMQGPVSEHEMKKVGKMVGATYLLLVADAAFQGNDSVCRDAVTARLVNLENGTVIAVDKSETLIGHAPSE